MPKGTKLEKILIGLANAGKYPSIAALSVNLGCVPTQNLISISDDGRYLAAPIDFRGDVNVMSEDRPVKMVLIDLEKKKVIKKFNGLYANPFYLSNTKRKIAFGEFGSSSEMKVSVIGGSKDISIPNAGYPSLDKNGNYLAYCKIDNERSVAVHSVKGVVRDLRTGKETDLGDRVFFPVFSPDGKRICYLKFDHNEEKIDDPTNFRIMVADRNGNGKKVIARIGRDIDEVYDYILPQWVGDDKLVFANVTPETGSDTEIFIYDLRNDTAERVTTNEHDEFYPTVLEDGRIVYLARLDPKERGICGTLNIAERKNGGWEHKELFENSVLSHKSCGNRIAFTYASVIENGRPARTNTALIDLRNLDEKPLDLEEVIKQVDLGEFPINED